MPADTIERRYLLSAENLNKIIPYCNRVFLYDNSQYLRCVGVIENGVVLNDMTMIPGYECPWAESILRGLQQEQAYDNGRL